MPKRHKTASEKNKLECKGLIKYGIEAALPSKERKSARNQSARRLTRGRRKNEKKKKKKGHKRYHFGTPWAPRVPIGVPWAPKGHQKRHQNVTLKRSRF